MARQTKNQKIAELEGALAKAHGAAWELYVLAVAGGRPGWLQIEAREIIESLTQPPTAQPYNRATHPHDK